MASSATRLQRVDSVAPKNVSFSLRSKPAIACLLLAVATLAFYNPVAHCGFVYSDDVVYVMQNPAIDSGLTWEAVKFAFTSVNTGLWHPVTWFSHALDCQLFGMNPTGHHYVSLLIHTGNAILLFLLLMEATGAAWPSLVVAALFALHPQNVESVAWASERKNVLSMLFFLLALWLYGRYAKQGGVGRYIGVLSLFTLGLLAKPQIITLPCVLLLWDYWPLGRMFAGKGSSEGGRAPRSLSYLVKEKLPLFALSAASAVVTVWSQGQVGAVRSLAELSFWARMGNAITSYIRYVAHTFWPTRLLPVYPYFGAPSATTVAAAALLLGVITIFVVYRRDLRYLSVGWFWFLGTMVPMIGIVQVGEQAMADRYAYLPVIGIFMVVAWAGADAVQKASFPKAAVGIAAALAVVSLGALTYRQLGYWRDGETLWGYAAHESDGNYLAHSYLAMVFNGEGKYDDAIKEFRAAEAIHTYPADQVFKIGLYEQRNGHLQGAVEQFQWALNRTSDASVRTAAWSQTGVAYAKMANFQSAQQSFDNVLQLNPHEPGALVASAILSERAGNFERAAGQFNDAVRVQPSDVGFLLLSDALQHAGRVQEAQTADDWARKISSNLDEAKKNARQIQMLFGYASQ
jgi:Tfp pilus assembly protein PilF